MRINSCALQSSMDTDHGLPIPMHRPFITLDDQYDEPLSFRRRLEQVTELTAESSSPYTLPKKRCLSRLEKLQFEIREQICCYVNIYPYKSFEHWLLKTGLISIQSHQTPWFNDPYCCFDDEVGLYRTNRNLRQELLEISLLNRAVSFQHPLNAKKLFYNNRNRNHCTRKLTE